MDSHSIALIAVLALCLIMSAYFSATETAFSSLNRIRLKNMAAAGHSRAGKALELADDYDTLLSTILIGNNIVNIASASLATVLFVGWYGDIGVTISTVVMTALVLIFGEILPKSFAKDNAEQVAFATARPLSWIKFLFTPLVWLFVQIKHIFTGRRSSELNIQPSVTEDELKTIVDTVEDEGVLSPQETGIIQSAIDFDDTTVQEILVPRVDMLAVDLDAPLEEVLSACVDEGFSRIPVYEGTIDNVVGILYAKDVLECLVKQRPVAVRTLMRPVLYVYRTKHINALLAEFRREKQHMAVVTDDYGGVMGLVTMEVILEELVGEIWDETDREEPPVRRLSDRCWEVAGEQNVEDFFEEIGFEDRDFTCGYSTVAGWALEVLEHIPAEGETFRYKDLKVTVEKMEEQRIAQLRVEWAAPPAPEQEGGT